MDRAKMFRVPEGVAKAEGLFSYEFHQVAIYTRDLDGAVSEMADLGFLEFYQDRAILDGYYREKHCRINAQMLFNYQMLPGKELEFVRYDGHPSREYSQAPAPFLSHMSAYVDNIDAAVERIADYQGFLPFHRFTTSEHSNPRVAGKKYFKEAIYETNLTLGFNVKLIEKVILHD